MNQSSLIITDFSPNQDYSFQVIDSQSIDFKKLYQDFSKKDDKNHLYIQTADPDAYFKELLKQVNFIKAAGGLVENDQEEYLFIKRLGKWDLPKGKLEEGEKMKETALREVEEECGIQVDVLGKKIKSTYHSYSMFGELIIKKTNWYKMKVHGKPELTPQFEEDITEVKWLGRDSFQMVRENTYPLIKELIDYIS
jgi:8-oxo-dGTP pyrophosphatase MutT (NUDIX family)